MSDEEIITLRLDSSFLLQIVSPRYSPGGMRCGLPKQYGLGLNFETGETFSVSDVRSAHKIKTALFDWAKEQTTDK